MPIKNLIMQFYTAVIIPRNNKAHIYSGIVQYKIDWTKGLSKNDIKGILEAQRVQKSIKLEKGNIPLNIKRDTESTCKRSVVLIRFLDSLKQNLKQNY